MGLTELVARKERPLIDVPVFIIVALIIAVFLQILLHFYRPAPVAKAAALPSPPEQASLELASMGEPVVMAKILMLWLQAFDQQPGLSISFRELDYIKITAWLERILTLDPRSRYPLLTAARVYADVEDADRKRQMLEFVYKKFLQDPEHRWPWLAHAVYVAKHRLHDLPLAYKYAKALREHTSARNIPDWARQMEIFILEDMGDIESAKVLIGGLIESGVITDINELRFLEDRLKFSVDDYNKHP